MKRYKHTESVTHLHIIIIIIIIISIDACGMVQTKRDFRTDTYLVASAGQIQNLKIFSLTWDWRWKMFYVPLIYNGDALRVLDHMTTLFLHESDFKVTLNIPSCSWCIKVKYNFFVYHQDQKNEILKHVMAPVARLQKSGCVYEYRGGVLLWHYEYKDGAAVQHYEYKGVVASCTTMNVWGWWITI